tara:strand:- start:162 stop:785 length:624 start_codon:yes stop_codon:yes gene_type:complete
MLTTKKTDLTFEQLSDNISKELKINNLNTVLLKQIHSNNVLYTNSSGFYEDYDGIVVDRISNLVPVIATADCIPLFIYDTVNGLYGIIHCGWRGVVSKIHLKALKIFFDKNSKIENIRIYLGPSIQGCCYEIGEEIVDNFHKDSISNLNGKLYLNLFKEISSDFFILGFKENNIKYSDICTYENNECYSYRRNNKNKGRMYSMMIKI